MYYVTMTDKFLSRWGKAEGKIAKFVYECSSRAEAEIVAENAERRGDQKNINITTNKPSYSSSTHYTQFKNREENPNWYQERFF